MKLKKILAGALAAAMAAAAMPLSVTVSAADYNVGDKFYAEFDKTTGEVVAVYDDVDQFLSNAASNYCYECNVLNDNSVAVTLNRIGIAYSNVGGKITIPSEINGCPVTEITHCYIGFASVTIPDTVKIIYDNAFSSNVYLEEIIFGKNSQLEIIDYCAFYDCRSLKSITIPASVKELRYGAFMNSHERDWDDYAKFENVFSLTTVKFAEGSKLETIGEYAFQLQKGIKSIEIPDGVTEIGKGAFIGCESLVDVTIPDSVTEISESVFSMCSDNLTIHASSNSRAAAYANEKGINFVATEVTTTPAATTTTTTAAATPEPEATTQPAATTAPAPSAGSTDGSNDEDKNQPTGVTLLVIPALAAASAIVIAKKRK